MLVAAPQALPMVLGPQRASLVPQRLHFAIQTQACISVSVAGPSALFRQLVLYLLQASLLVTSHHLMLVITYFILMALRFGRSPCKTASQRTLPEVAGKALQTAKVPQQHLFILIHSRLTLTLEML